jgi:hypothetical protein
VSAQAPPLPNTVDAFMSLIETGWDADVARRPHAQRTTVVVHLDLESRIAALHLGPLLSNDDRRYLTCDATCEVWFQRDGRVIGSGRATRTVGRRLRRVLEHRDRCCVIPGCGATRGLHAHHIWHWEDGGSTELSGGVPPPSPGTPSRRHHRTRLTPTRSQTLSRTYRRTRPMVVVPTLPTTTTTLNQLNGDDGPAVWGDVHPVHRRLDRRSGARDDAPAPNPQLRQRHLQRRIVDVERNHQRIVAGLGPVHVVPVGEM